MKREREDMSDSFMKTLSGVRCYSRKGRLSLQLLEEKEIDAIWEAGGKSDFSSRNAIAKFRATVRLLAGSEEQPCVALTGPRFELYNGNIVISKVGNKASPKECEELKFWGVCLGALILQLKKAAVPHRVENMHIRTEPGGKKPIPVTLIICQDLVDGLDNIFHPAMS